MAKNIFKKVLEESAQKEVGGKNSRAYKKYPRAIRRLLINEEITTKKAELRKCWFCDQILPRYQKLPWCQLCEITIENLKIGFALQNEKQKKFVVCKTCIKLFEDSKKLILGKSLEIPRLVRKSLKTMVTHLQASHAELFYTDSHFYTVRL